MGCVKSSEVAPIPKPLAEISFRDKYEDEKRGAVARVETNPAPQELIEMHRQQSGEEEGMRTSGRPGWSKPQDSFLPIPQAQVNVNESPVNIIYESDRMDKMDLYDLKNMESLESIPPPPPKKPLIEIHEIKEDEQMNTAQMKRILSEAKQEQINNLIKVGVNDIMIEGGQESEQLMYPFKLLLPKVQMNFPTIVQS